MKIQTNCALLGAALTLALAPGASAATGVTVRVEGAKRTLLPATATGTRGPAVVRGGHRCPGSSAMGALDRATHGRWSGTYFAGLGFEPMKILGETATFARTKSYFEFFVNHVAASVGLCSQRLHRGQEILLAAVPATGTEYPLGLRAAKTARVGHAVRLSVVAYNARGNARRLAGPTITVSRRGGGSGATVSSSARSVTFSRPGTYVVRAGAKGYIRDEVTIKVRG